MSEHAEITSIDAIADFRAALLIYISKVRPLLDDSADEVFRTREWLRVSQRVYWENQIRTRTRELTDAQQALFSAELAKLRAPSSAEIVAVQKAKRALGVAEDKLHTLKRASANFEREAVPRLKQIENLRTVVATDLQEAVHFLDRIVGTLDRYVNSGPTSSSNSTLASAPVEETSTERSEQTE
jgi:hypothetical protein